MDNLFRDMIVTLSRAQQAVESELELLIGHRPSGAAHLADLRQSVEEFSKQADDLLVMMLERDVDADLMNAAEALVDFFRDTEEQLVALLRTGQARAADAKA